MHACNAMQCIMLCVSTQKYAVSPRKKEKCKQRKGGTSLNLNKLFFLYLRLSVFADCLTRFSSPWCSKAYFSSVSILLLSVRREIKEPELLLFLLLYYDIFRKFSYFCLRRYDERSREYSDILIFRNSYSKIQLILPRSRFFPCFQTF